LESTGNNYGREAAAFLNSSNCNKQWVFFGQLETTTVAKRLPSYTVAKRPPSFYWTIGNYGNNEEAAAFLNWATGINKWVTFLASGNIYGREAAAILKWCNWHQ
jgi:hypothetical protein